MSKAFISYMSENSRRTSIDQLNSRLADIIELTLAVKQAHWNIKGSSFIGIHELLDAVADRLRDNADTIAERCVLLGGQARGTLQSVSEDSALEAYPVEAQNQAVHVEALTERFMAVGKRLRESIDAAAEAGDEDTADLFTEVSRIIDKDAWFIGSHNEHGHDA